jgi:hypothetical protein
MTARGMSLRATARAAGYSDHTLLSKVLSGHKPVSPYMAAALDEALGAGGEIREAAAAADAARHAVREAYERGRADALAEVAAFTGR